MNIVGKQSKLITTLNVKKMFKKNNNLTHDKNRHILCLCHDDNMTCPLLHNSVLTCHQTHSEIT